MGVLPLSRIKEAVASAQKRRGVVVGINKLALQKYRLFKTGDDGIAILTPEGLSLSAISSITPLGPEEAKYLNEVSN
jgi:hypothetical protein